jgi:hypothetical protein
MLNIQICTVKEFSFSSTPCDSNFRPLSRRRGLPGPSLAANG